MTSCLGWRHERGVNDKTQNDNYSDNYDDNYNSQHISEAGPDADRLAPAHHQALGR
jgi:hypothetical protein